MAFRVNWLKWNINRPARTFRVYVVEPYDYSSDKCQDIFSAALLSLVVPSYDFIEPGCSELPIKHKEKFDLITFPEAFICSDDIVQVFEKMQSIESMGCVHVGLRSSQSRNETHLFNPKQIKDLVKKNKSIPAVEQTDLDFFSGWLEDQPGSANFNIGCMFLVDDRGMIRVCLHPKIVRSKYELSALHEEHMTEADLLSIVTLFPKNKEQMTLTLQPLLCSDALNISTDRINAKPLDAITTCADSFSEHPPDHVDIVSLSTCTPLQSNQASVATSNRQWHQLFRDAFIRAASEDSCLRHHFSAFILSNYSKITPSADLSGMSGVFLPSELSQSNFPDYINLSCYGKTSDEIGYRWFSQQKDGSFTPKGKAFLACFDVEKVANKFNASMLGFTLHRLLRDKNLFDNSGLLTDFELISADDQDQGDVSFRIRG